MGTSLNTFSQEIIDLFIDNVAYTDDSPSRSLKFLSLVAQSWLPRTRKHLFHHLTLTTEPKAWSRICAVVFASPFILGSVHVLSISIHGCFEDGLGESDLVLPDVPFLNLTALHLVGWGSLPRLAQLVQRNRNMTSLILQGFRLSSAALADLRACFSQEQSDLRELGLHFIRLDRKAWEICPITLPRVEELLVGYVLGRDMTNERPFLETPELKSLTVGNPEELKQWTTHCGSQLTQISVRTNSQLPTTLGLDKVTNLKHLYFTWKIWDYSSFVMDPLMNELSALVTRSSSLQCLHLRFTHLVPGVLDSLLLKLVERLPSLVEVGVSEYQLKSREMLTRHPECSRLDVSLLFPMAHATGKLMAEDWKEWWMEIVPDVWLEKDALS